MANSKDVVVTGVSTGIGWGTTKVLVSKGFRVFGTVRKPVDADRLQKEFGEGFVPLMMDITDADAVHQAAQGSARKDARRPARKAARTHKAVAVLERQAFVLGSTHLRARRSTECDHGHFVGCAAL